MNIGELSVKLNALVKGMPDLLLRQTEVAALDALALVDMRITQTGTDANGSAFEDYTPSYKKFKAKKGRYRGHVDFQLSGQMLASTTTGFENIAATEKSVSGAQATVTFAGRDELTKKKLEGNDNKRPGFMLPSAKEVKEVSGMAQERIERDIIALLA